MKVLGIACSKVTGRRGFESAKGFVRIDCVGELDLVWYAWKLDARECWLCERKFSRVGSREEVAAVERLPGQRFRAEGQGMDWKVGNAVRWR